MEKIKIVYLCKNLRVNGISNVVLNYCNYIDKNKFDVTVFAGEKICKEYVNELERNSVKFVETPEKNFKNIIKYYKFIKKNIRQDNCDIVHINGNSSTLFIELLIFYLNKIKIRIAHCHSTSTSNKFIHFLFKPLLKKLYTYGFACSDNAGKWMFGNYKYEVIPNAFNTNIFKYNEELRIKLRNKLKIKDKFIIGHVGLFNEHKNQLFMLDVFNKVAEKNENAYLLFIGGGVIYKKIVDEKIKKHKYKDRIICYGEAQNVNELYNIMDVFFFPSKSEGLGIALLEAQINGLNCVISDKIPKFAIISNNVKVLSLDNSLEKWADEIINSKQKYNREKQYEENKKEIDKFEIKNVILNIEKIYMEQYKKLKR